MDHAIVRPDFEIVRTLANLARHYGKRYCYPSQDKLLSLHEQRTGRLYSRATMNRHLLALELAGWITRLRRHRRADDGSLELHSTLYEITRKTYERIAALVHSLRSWIGDNLFVVSRGRCLNLETKGSPKTESNKSGATKHAPDQRLIGQQPRSLAG